MNKELELTPEEYSAWFNNQDYARLLTISEGDRWVEAFLQKLKDRGDIFLKVEDPYTWYWNGEAQNEKGIKFIPLSDKES